MLCSALCLDSVSRAVLVLHLSKLGTRASRLNRGLEILQLFFVQLGRTVSPLLRFHIHVLLSHYGWGQVHRIGSGSLQLTSHWNKFYHYKEGCTYWALLNFPETEWFWLQGLTDAGARNASTSGEYAYLRNPIWWAGISTCESHQLSHRNITSSQLLYSGAWRKW